MLVSVLDISGSRDSTIFELFSGEDKTLLIGWDSFFVLDFRFNVVDCVRGLDFKGDGFTRQSLDEDLHYVINTC